MRYTVLTVGIDKILRIALDKVNCHQAHVVHIDWPQLLTAPTDVKNNKNQLRFVLEISEGISLDSQSLTGIISFDRHIPRACLAHNYHQDDQEYCFSAWQSNWLSLHKSVKKSINCVDYSMLQANYLTLPHCYSLAHAVGLDVPKWNFCSQKSLPIAYLSTANKSLLHNHNFSQSSSTGMLAIEYIQGDPVVVLVIGKKIVARRIKSLEVNIQIPIKVSSKMLKLKMQLGIDVCEIFCKINDGRWIVLRVVTKPEWGRWWLRDLDSYAGYLLDLLKPPQGKKPKKHPMFIKKNLRPFCGSEQEPG